MSQANPTSAPLLVTRPTSRLLRDGVVVAAAVTVANVAAYGLTLFAARRLGPSEFGALAALLGLVVVGYVASTSVQTVTTRRVAAARSRSGAVDRDGLARTALLFSATTGVAALAAAYPLQAFLHLPSAVPVLLVAATLVPLTWTGYLLGLAQGAERFGLLAVLFLLVAAGRLGGAILGVLLVPSLTGIMEAMALGMLAAACLATFLARDSVGAPRGASVAARETGHAIHSLLALFLLSNLDLLLARHYLPADEAGLYGVGSVITKVALWLPQFVVVLALPRMGDAARRVAAVRASLLLMAASGLLVTLGAALIGGRTLSVLAGGGYADLGAEAWRFAFLGASLSLAQLLLFSRIARRDRRAVYALWIAILVEVAVVGAFAHDSLAAVVTTACATTGLLVLVGVARELADHRADATLTDSAHG